MKMNGIDKQTIRYAISLAAGWAWGVSLVVGMQTVHQKGILPFLIWAIANSFSLPLFGWIAFKIPNLVKIVNTKAVQIFMTLVMVFCLWIQMNAIKEVFQDTGFFNATLCTVIPIVLMLILAAVLYNDGLMRNVLLDNPLWTICYVILVIIAVYGFVTRQPWNEIALVENSGDINWALNSCLILFAGPIMNIQNWQMAEKLHAENRMRSHTIAGIIFGIYMLFVFVLSFLQFNPFMNTLLIPTILCITLTTADAAIVGMQKIAGKKWGAVMALLAIVFWRAFQNIGVLELWTYMGNARLYVAIGCILVAFGTKIMRKRGRVNE